MINSFWKRVIFTCIIQIVIVPLTWPAVFSNYNLARARFVVQESPAAPATDFAFFGFTASAYFQPVSEQPQASVLSPGGINPRNLSPGLLAGSLVYQVDYYFSEFQLDVEYPSGGYTVTLRPDLQTDLQAQIQVPSGSFPAPVYLTNYAVLQSIDPEQQLNLSLSDSGLIGDEDTIQVILSDGATVLFHTPAPGFDGALAASTTSVSIPAGTLYPGGEFTLSLINHDVTTVDTAQIPGTTGTAAIITVTRIRFETTGSYLPDTDPPLVIHADPAIGATGVDPDTTVTFHFNEPMAPGVSIAWEPAFADGEFSYDWSEDGRVLTCALNGGFPLGQEIRWTLNPTAENSQMADLLGNRIPTGLVTGSFTTASATYGIAPEALLPGPVALIGNDPDTGMQMVRIAAESLKGYMIQQSTDLVTWQTIESVTNPSSLVEFPVPVPLSGEPAFYRATQNGYTPDFLYDEIAGRSRIIYPDGGTVETIGSNGIRYVLTVPAGAVVAPVRIYITPLLEILPSPLSQGVVTGALLEPAGLNLLQAAELRMYLPAATDPVDLIGFISKSSGYDFHWCPWTLENGNEVVMELVHFGTAGVGRGSPEEHQAMEIPCDSIAEMDHQLAIIAAQIETAVANRNQKLKNQLIDSATALIQQAYDNLVAPAFTQAATDRNLLPCAMMDYVRLNTRATAFTGKGLPVPLDAAAAMQNAWDVAYANCSLQDDYREIANLLWLQAVDQLHYGGVLQNAGQQELANCISLKMDFRSGTHYQGIDYAGKHAVEANNISMVPAAQLSHVEGSAALLYDTFELVQANPECDPGVMDLSPFDGQLNIWKGYVYSGDFLLNGCDCETISMDPDTWSKVDFAIVFLIDSPPLEFWQQCSTDPFTGQSTYAQQGATRWKDSFAAAHESEVNFDLSGSYFEPLYMAFTEFDFLNRDVNGRRVVAQKQVFRYLPDIDPVWWEFENTSSETWITIWLDTPAPQAK